MKASMTITVIGTGFVGVVTAAVFASFGNKVHGLDVDEKKVAALQKGHIPFFEPGLEELTKAQLKNGHLHFTTQYQATIPDSEVIFIAVGTPSAPDGQADLRFVFSAAESLAPHLSDNAIVVIKSTVPPGTNQKVEERIKAKTKKKFFVASMPEFLREGTAVEDTLHPHRIVIGSRNEMVREKLAELHQPFQAPILFMTPESAQMAKYAANSYLATRITFINQIADLCEKNGADILEVIKGIGEDKRIGSHYWYPGFGYGGSCFPKDVKELAAYSRSVGEQDNLLNRVSEINEARIFKLLDKYEKKIDGWQGKKVAVLGLSFKPHTDDVREAPSLKVVPYLLAKEAEVATYDPMVSFAQFTSILSKNGDKALRSAATIEKAITDVDVIMALVEWPEIIHFNFSQSPPQKKVWFIDARDQFDADQLKKAGYSYIGVGRS